MLDWDIVFDRMKLKIVLVNNFFNLFQVNLLSNEYQFIANSQQ